MSSCSRCRSDENVEPVIDGARLAIAIHCNGCHRVLQTRCLVCLGWFRDLAHHHRASECGAFHVAGKWWRAEQPAARVDVRAPEQRELFS